MVIVRRFLDKSYDIKACSNWQSQKNIIFYVRIKNKSEKNIENLAYRINDKSLYDTFSSNFLANRRIKWYNYFSFVDWKIRNMTIAFQLAIFTLIATLSFLLISIPVVYYTQIYYNLSFVLFSLNKMCYKIEVLNAYTTSSWYKRHWT